MKKSKLIEKLSQLSGDPEVCIYDFKESVQQAEDEPNSYGVYPDFTVIDHVPEVAFLEFDNLFVEEREEQIKTLTDQLEACKEFIRAITVVRKGELININVSVGNMGESYDKLRELYKKTGV